MTILTSTILIPTMYFPGAGLTWKNFSKPVSSDTEITMAHIMMMFLVDCVLYLLITWYVDNVRPGEYGIPRKFYFPFTVCFFRY